MSFFEQRAQLFFSEQRSAFFSATKFFFASVAQLFAFSMVFAPMLKSGPENDKARVRRAK